MIEPDKSTGKIKVKWKEGNETFPEGWKIRSAPMHYQNQHPYLEKGKEFKVLPKTSPEKDLETEDEESFNKHSEEAHPELSKKVSAAVGKPDFKCNSCQ